MAEHDTPRNEAPHGAADPETAPETAHDPATSDTAAGPTPGGEGLRRWLPRRRPAAGATAEAQPTDSAADQPATAVEAAPGSVEQAAASEAAGTGEAAPKPQRRWGRRRPAQPEPATEAPAADAGADDAAPAAVAADTETNPGRLRRRRKRLISDREVAVYHLGGLAFELYRRDLLAEDVLRRRAGAVALIDESVHDIDTRLEQLDSERRERRSRRGEGALTTAGNCLACRAPFQDEARFCWQCGARLTPPDPDLDAQITQAIPTPPA